MSSNVFVNGTSMSGVCAFIAGYFEYVVNASASNTHWGEGDRVLRSTRSPTQTTRLTLEQIFWISCELLIFIQSNVVNIYYIILCL